MKIIKTYLKSKLDKILDYFLGGVVNDIGCLSNENCEFFRCEAKEKHESARKNEDFKPGEFDNKR